MTALKSDLEEDDKSVLSSIPKKRSSIFAKFNLDFFKAKKKNK